ncbi:MAG: replicative DNA helicase [Myxococcales bacterium FL481]|nr:MAG: replicative DNA helicase [Myxococcales bacterium FL481]
MSDLRTLPHNSEAESAVLGGVLLRGREALIDVQDVLGAEDFYIPANQAVFNAMIALDQSGDPIDVITLESRLRARDELKLVGGIEALGRLADRYATSHNIDAHARLVRDAAMVRRLVVAAREVAEEGMGDLEDVRAFVDQAEQRVLAVNEAGRKTGFRPSRDLVLEVFRGISERQKYQSAVTGVPTGFAKLDDMTAGLQPGDLIILAARPSMGKTAFALNLAQAACIWTSKHMGLKEDERPPLYPVLFFSLEMGASQLIERVLCSEAQVDYSNLRVGRFVESDYRQLIAAADRISSAKLFIDDTAAPSILEIRNSARRWKGDRNIFADPSSKLGLIVVDYLQLVRGGKGRYDSREQEISEISRGLKALAKELRVPVIALSQLNRAVDSRADHRPMLSDLRESGAIEQDADVIMFIFREERYLTSEASEEKRREVENKAEVIIGKQRNGPIGTVHLIFRKQITRFENPAGPM